MTSGSELVARRIEDRDGKRCKICHIPARRLGNYCITHENHLKKYGTLLPIIDIRRVVSIFSYTVDFVRQNQDHPQIAEALEALKTYIGLCPKSGDRYKLTGRENALVRLGELAQHPLFDPVMLLGRFCAPAVLERYAELRGLPAIYPVGSAYRIASARLALAPLVLINKANVSIHIYNIIRQRSHKVHRKIADQVALRLIEIFEGKRHYPFRERMLTNISNLEDFAIKRKNRNKEQ